MTTSTHARIAVEEAVAYGFLTALGGYAFIIAFDYGFFIEGNRVGPGLDAGVVGGLIMLSQPGCSCSPCAGTGPGTTTGWPRWPTSVHSGRRSTWSAGSDETDDPDAEAPMTVDIFGRTPAQRMRQLQTVFVALVVALLLVPLLGSAGAPGAVLACSPRSWSSGGRGSPRDHHGRVHRAWSTGSSSVFLDVPLPTGVLGIGG